MEVLNSSKIVFCDVDDTLVMWDWRAIDPEGKGLMEIVNPDTNRAEHVMPHFRHIELLKQFHVRGHTIIVWSQGGAEWAGNVCRALGIEDMVHLAMNKPDWYIDDLPSSAFMKSPIYLDPTDPKKDSRWGISHVGETNDKIKDN